MLRVATRLLALFLLLSGCAESELEAEADGSVEQTEEADVQEATQESTSPSTTPTATVTQDPVQIHLRCQVGPSGDQSAMFTLDSHADFSQVWATPEVHSCQADRSAAPLTSLEQQALAVSGYTQQPAHAAGRDIVTIYEYCAENSRHNFDFASIPRVGDYALRPDQIAEVEAVLVLCPGHPMAGEFRADADRSRADNELEAQGRLFGSGTHLVGSEIQPGTYYSEGLLGSSGVSGCYWERQDSAGETIDNNFINSARRVEVTIRSSDYAFSSDNCGTWRPVG